MSDNKLANELKHKAELRMVELLDEITEELLRRVQSGDASPQDISNAIRLLKENGIDIHVSKGDPLDILKEEVLPFESSHLKAVDNNKK